MQENEKRKRHPVKDRKEETGRQTSRQVGRQTGRLTDRQMVREIQECKRVRRESETH